MGIDWVVKKQLCSGCGACVVACPHNAIELIEEDYNKPYLTNNLCKECGICIDVCPGVLLYNRILHSTKDVRDYAQGNILRSVLGFSKDNELRLNASSGGLISSILIKLLEMKQIDGAIVVKSGSFISNDVFIAISKEDIIEAKGSRYSPVSMCMGLDELKNLKGKFAFVGKPCEIEACNRMSHKLTWLKEKIVIKIAIFCHHTPPYSQSLKLINFLNIDRNDVKNIQYRGNGWPGKITIELKNSEKIGLPYRIGWDKILSKKINTRCLLCDDPLGRFSDISVGDPWGYQCNEEEYGRSIALIRNRVGEGIVDKLDNTILEELDNNNTVWDFQPGLTEKLSSLKIRRKAYLVVFERNKLTRKYYKNFHQLKSIISMWLRKKGWK